MNSTDNTNPRSGTAPLPSERLRVGDHRSGGAGGRLHYGYEMADPFYYTLLKEFANELRQKPTEAEKIMWDCLKGNFGGIHFRRQHVIGLFIADYVCLKKKLIIEIDGGYHQLPEQQISDQKRTEWLENKVFKVLLFSNDEIIGNIDGVLESNKTYIIKEQIKPPPTPPKGRGDKPPSEG